MNLATEDVYLYGWRMVVLLWAVSSQCSQLSRELLQPFGPETDSYRSSEEGRLKSQSLTEESPPKEAHNWAVSMGAFSTVVNL